MPGPHGFAVRSNVVRFARLRSLTRFNPPCDRNACQRSRVHHIPFHVRDDARPPLLPEQDGRNYATDLGFRKSRILPDGLICRRGAGRASHYMRAQSFSCVIFHLYGASDRRILTSFHSSPARNSSTFTSLSGFFGPRTISLIGEFLPPSVISSATYGTC